MRGQVVLVAPEVMGEGGCGDGGDGDFVEEVGGGPGPLRRSFEEFGDGFEDRRGWSLVQSVQDGLFTFWEGGDGPVRCIGVTGEWGLGLGGGDCSRFALNARVMASHRAARSVGRMVSNSCQSAASVRRVVGVSGARRMVSVRSARGSSGFQPGPAVMRMGRWSSWTVGSRSSPFSRWRMAAPVARRQSVAEMFGRTWPV